MFNYWLTNQYITLCTPLFKWKIFSRCPIFGAQYLGFYWLVLCVLALVGKTWSWAICSKKEKKSSRFGLLVAELLHPRDRIYYMPYMRMPFYIWLPFFMQTNSKGTHRLPRVYPFSCNHILGELLCSWADSLHTPPTLDILFFVYCLHNL